MYQCKESIIQVEEEVSFLLANSSQKILFTPGFLERNLS